MTKVLNIISDTNIGGAGRVLLNYLNYADRSQFETLVAVPRGSRLKDPLLDVGVKVLEVDGLADRSYDSSDVRALLTLIRETAPDLVHTHGALSGRIAARRCKIPVIYTRHSAFPVPAKLRYPPGRWINKFINEHYADHIIAVSPAARDNLTQAGISSRKITVMMNGVAPVERRSPEACAALRSTWEIPDGDFVVGILARLEPYKGHTDILHALHTLVGEGRQITLLIAGDGSCEQALRQETAKLGLDEHVRFLGFLSDVAGFLSVLNLQLNASYGTETSSLSILEGMSMGLPAVVSDYGGNPWLVDDGVDGLIFPTHSSGSLAKAIARLMDDRAELGRMGDAAHRIFSQRFTGEIFARNIEQVYCNVLSACGKGVNP